MVKKLIKEVINKLPNQLSVPSKALARKVLRFFDGRDIADGMIDFNKLPYFQEFKRQGKERIALIYNIYYQHKNFKKFIKQIQRYENFSFRTLQNLEIIIIDDGSPYPLPLPNLNLNISLLRIKKDIPWNGGGARNLGASYATAEKLLFCDIDHFIPETTLVSCIETNFEKNTLYLLEWKNPVYVLPNIFCIRKDTFFSLHGYDEAYSGFYGDDVFFRKYLEEKNISFVRTGWEAINSAEKYFGEHNLSRSLLKAKQKLKKRARGEHSDYFLHFPWTFVKNYRHISKGGNDE